MHRLEIHFITVRHNKAENWLWMEQIGVVR